MSKPFVGLQCLVFLWFERSGMAGYERNHLGAPAWLLSREVQARISYDIPMLT